MSKSIHDGHRERLRQEIIKNGFNESTPDHKILEFLLFYCISRKDTNPLAHNLINHFGSFANVLDAPFEELAAFEGMGERSALLLKSIMPISRLYVNKKKNDNKYFKDIDAIGDFAVNQFLGITSERVGVISLDAKGKLLGFDFIAEGDVSSVSISAREVLSYLYRRNAVTAVLVHNHPSGFAVPSEIDSKITARLVSALREAGVYLIDHIIVGNDDFVSMSQSKKYSYIFE